MAQVDLRALPRDDKAFLGLGALVFIASFLPWYGASFSGSVLGKNVSESSSTNAWHSWAALGLILMLVATGIVVAQLFAAEELPALKVSWNVVVVVLDAVGALLIVVKSFNLPSGSGLGISVGLRWGGWVLIIAAIAQVVFAALRFRSSGEPMPWAHHTAEAPPPGV